MKEKTILQRKEIFKTTKENLWNALTNVNLMEQGYFKEINFFEPKTGSKTLFSIEYEGKNFYTQMVCLCSCSTRKNFLSLAI
jgi:hypothetical protein